MITAGEVVLHARNRHPAFEEKVTPDKVLFGRLEELQEELVQEIVAVYPDALDICTKRIDLPLVDFARGAAFPENLYVFTGKVRYETDELKDLHPVPRRQLASPSRWPAAAVVGCRFYLARTEEFWRHAREITVPYIAIPDRLENLKSEFALPTIARNVLIDAAALFLAKRTPGVGTTPFEADAKASTDRFMETITSRRRANRQRIQRRA